MVHFNSDAGGELAGGVVTREAVSSSEGEVGGSRRAMVTALGPRHWPLSRSAEFGWRAVGSGQQGAPLAICRDLT